MIGLIKPTVGIQMTAFAPEADLAKDQSERLRWVDSSRSSQRPPTARLRRFRPLAKSGGTGRVRSIGDHRFPQRQRRPMPEAVCHSLAPQQSSFPDFNSGLKKEALLQ
jgi:hypothetical protein